MNIELQKTIHLKVRDLEILGISSQSIITIYQSQFDKRINLEDYVKVSPKDEGKMFKFETWDEVAITVSVDDASGSFNKVN